MGNCCSQDPNSTPELNTQTNNMQQNVVAAGEAKDFTADQRLAAVML
jgi:hypothetical protein